MLSNFARNEMIISSYEYSKLVNSPINRVQETFQNLSGMKYRYSVEDLNEMYLEFAHLVESRKTKELNS